MDDDRIDALFALRPEDFIAARNDLARQLRAAGERERAKDVARLRRPTVAAWAVNQAVRADREAYGGLLEAGRESRRAQRRALSGMTKSGLREASRARRQHIERLAEQAAGLLADAGGDPAPHRDDILATFDAASATEEAGEEVGDARLSRPLAAPSSFDDLAALSVVSPEPEGGDQTAGGGESDESDGSDDAEPDRAAEQRRAAAAAVAAARRGAEEAASARQQAQDAAEAARRKADEVAREAEKAVADAERARREADRQQRRAEAARRDARRRSDEASDADGVAEDRARDLEQAEERLRALEDRPTRGRA